jgi:hypothetical protein
LIYHLVEADRKADAQAYLQNLCWLQKKVETKSVFSLTADFSTFQERWARQEEIAVFGNLVKRQAYIIKENLALMFK